ncbi:MAG: DUF1573 domain-containing protein [Thermoguttaceae bacterium]|nr:DUF1573 domain-containing protein [Thermoguttaceae bacterium]
MKSGANHLIRFYIRRLSLAAAALILLASGMPAGAQPYSSSNSWAVKMFDEAGGVMTRNFGDLALHSEAEQRFQFRNIYKEDVVILSAQSSCSCTNVTVPKKVVKSGEMGEIVARVDTSGKVHVGKRKVTITVHFNRPYAAEVQLHVSAMIRADVVFDPGVVEFGSVGQGVPVTKTVFLQYNGQLANWQLVGMKKNSPSIRAEAKVVSRTGSRKTYKVDVQLLPTAEPGYISDLLRFTSNEAGSPGIFVPVHGQVISALSVKPTHLQFGVIHPNESATRNLVVRGSTPFRIQSVQSDDPRMQFKTANQESTVHVIPVTLTASADETPGEFRKSIKVKTTIAELPALDIAVFGIISGEQPVSEEEKPQETALTASLGEALSEYRQAQSGPALGSFDDLTLPETQSAAFVPVETQVAPPLDAPSPAAGNDLPIPAQISQKYSNRYLAAQKIEESSPEEHLTGVDAPAVPFELDEHKPGRAPVQAGTENAPSRSEGGEPEIGEQIAVDDPQSEEEQAGPAEVEVAESGEAPAPEKDQPAPAEAQTFAPAKPETPFAIDPATGSDKDGWFPAKNAAAPQKTENKNAAAPQSDRKKTASPGRSKVAVIKSLFLRNPEVR